MKAVLMVTGDDFGASERINRAVAEAYDAGALTQAGLMVEGESVVEALKLARERPGLALGLHLVIAESRPGWNGVLYAVSGLERQRVGERLRRQFGRFGEFGLESLWWDGHMHLHLHPAVFDLALPLASEYGFRAARVVRERGRGVLPRIFRGLSARARPLLDAAGMRYVGETFGLAVTGRMTPEYAAGVCPEKLGELYWHPGDEPEGTTAERMAAALGGVERVSWRDVLEM